MPSTELNLTDQQTCLQLARDSIRYGLEHGRPLPVNPADFSPALQKPGASFVTLHKHGDLRGCIGSLQAHQPLITDISEHAFAAAFQDPRFAPLAASEYDDLTLDISVLSEPEPIHFKNESDLLSQLRPGIDGLILESGYHRGTFLPSVWEQLPTTTEFFNQLKRKAGLPVQWWDNTAKISRYQTQYFS